MKTKYINILASLAIAGSGMLTSCSLDLQNPDGPGALGFYDEQDKFVLNMIAITQEWRGDFDVNMMRNAGELRAGIYTITGIDGSALNDITYINNALDEAHPQFTNFAGFYGTIGNINAFLYYADQNADVFTSDVARSYLVGMAHGMRAWCYFQLYKMYGTCPLRLEPDVLLGNFNAVALAMPRADAESVLSQIKADIKTSLDNFNAGASYNDARVKTVNFWNKAATEMLAGEVYLWSGKVTTGNHTATPADVATAKGYFENVATQYGYAMQSDYANVFSSKGNKEVIFATYYGYGIATANWYFAALWNPTTGTGRGTYWSCYGDDGVTPTSYANRLAYYVNAAGVQSYNNFYYHGIGNIVNRYQYSNALWYQYDELDSRRDATFMDNYLVAEDEKELNFIADFDKDAHHLAGAFLFKYRGELPQGQTYISGTNDMIYYRLPLAYMYLAEIANYDGDNAGVERYINMLRQRAYGSNYDESIHGYKAGSFRQNEVAILQEKTKEFIAEGQRWWDIRRLTAVKGGSEQDHLVFQPESCAGWGLDLAAHPNWNEVCSDISNLANCPLVTNQPVLDYATQGHMILWPINTALISDVVTQTPGY